MGKSKKDKPQDEDAAASDNEAQQEPQQQKGPIKLTYEQQLHYITPIANPLVSEKTNKKLLKLIRRAKRQKKVHQGVKLIPKLIVKKKQRGLVVIAGDVTPIDVVSHLPLLLEENNVPYCYTPSKREIGAACGSKRGIALVFVQRHDDFGDLFDKMHDKLQQLPLPIS